ncbi:MAG: Rrf2 family transcriptional regulator, partial [Oscillospiraceae bacterium]
MNITLEADYAIRIVYCLATENKRVEAKSIAEITGVTLRFSLKILRKLVAAEIIKSFKGTQGGYELAKPASEISLYDIIYIIEGPYNFSKCGFEDFICTRKPDKNCKIRKVFLKITKSVVQQ